MTPKTWQRIEGGGVFILALTLAIGIGGLPWWGIVLALFVPDLFAVGYVFGPRVGAALYNAAHLYLTGMVIYAAASVIGHVPAQSLGALWVAHAGIDRAFGYGLKQTSGFQDTHLGRIGR